MIPPIPISTKPIDVLKAVLRPRFHRIFWKQLYAWIPRNPGESFQNGFEIAFRLALTTPEQMKEFEEYMRNKARLGCISGFTGDKGLEDE